MRNLNAHIQQMVGHLFIYFITPLSNNDRDNFVEIQNPIKIKN